MKTLRYRMLLAGTALLSVVSARSLASFEENQYRYLAPFDILATLRKVFPQSKGLPVFCTELGPVNRAVIGDSDPDSGKPIMSEPTSGFMRWYSGCLRDALEASAGPAKDLLVSTGKSSAFEALFGPECADWVRAASDGGRGREARLSGQWSRIDGDLRRRFFHYQLLRMIGPEPVLQDLSRGKVTEGSLFEFMESSLDRKQSAFEALKGSLRFLALRNEFLSY